MSDSIKENQTSILLGDRAAPRKKATNNSNGTTKMSNLNGMTIQDLKKELIEITTTAHRQECTIRGLRLALDAKEVSMDDLRKRYNKLASGISLCR